MWVICHDWSKNHWCSPLNFKLIDWILTVLVQISTFWSKLCQFTKKSCIFQSTNALYMWECMYMEKSCLFCRPRGLGGGDGGISTARYVWQWKSRLQQFVQNRGRQSLLNMYIVCTSTWPLILRSLRSVMQLQIICVVSTHKLVIVSEGFKILALYLFVFFIVHISVHRVFVLIPLKKQTLLGTNVLSFLQHSSGMMCSVSSVETSLAWKHQPASLNVNAGWVWFLLSHQRAVNTRLFCFFGGSSLFCCSGSFMYRISFPQRIVLSLRNANGHKPRGDLAFDGNVWKFFCFF